MVSEGQDKLTFVLPAPSTTRDETDILWYEVAVSATDSRCLISAVNGSTKDVASEADTILVTRTTARTTLSEGDVTVTLETSFGNRSDGEPDIHQVINGRGVDIRPLAESASALPDVKLDLSEHEARLLSQWARLGDPITTMAEVSVAQSATRAWGGWGCALVLTGTALLAASCVTAPTLVTCGATLVAGGTFLGRCT